MMYTIFKHYDYLEEIDKEIEAGNFDNIADAYVISEVLSNIYKDLEKKLPSDVQWNDEAIHFAFEILYALHKNGVTV